jgi:inosose dehydratase
MPGEQYKGKLEHIMHIIAQAGLEGIEPETSFLQHLEDPLQMKEALAKYNLELPVLCVVEDWLHAEETPAEKERAQKWIDFLSHFPDCMLLMVQMPGKDRKHLKERQDHLLACVNAFAKRAVDAGITCSYHPNSPQGSIFRTETDYEILLNGLDASCIGYCPDVGHIAKGGMKPRAIMEQYRDLINLVHYKDMYEDGTWAATGEGSIDFINITKDLIDNHYNGWIIMEDECDACITDPDGVTLKNRDYIDEVLRPLVG